MTDKKQPVGKTRIGGITVTTWENEITVDNKPKTILTHTPEKSYKEKDSEEWKVSKSYSTHELPKLILCLQEQYRLAVLAKEQ